MTPHQKDLASSFALELRGLNSRGEYGGRAAQIKRELAGILLVYKAGKTYYRCRTGAACLDLDHAISTWTAA